MWRLLPHELLQSILSLAFYLIFPKKPDKMAKKTFLLSVQQDLRATLTAGLITIAAPPPSCSLLIYATHFHDLTLRWDTSTPGMVGIGG